MRVLVLLAMGYTFQVFGCQNTDLGEFLATSIKDAAIGIGSIVIGAALDEAFGFSE